MDATNIRFSVVDYERPDAPVYMERDGSQYVSYGEDNLYPQFLLKLREKSATANTIINGFVEYIAGNEVQVLEGASVFTDSFNRRGDTADDIVRQLGDDYATFGGFALQIIYSKLGTIAEIYALPFANVRSSKDGTRIYYCEDWTMGGNAKMYPSFDRSKSVIDEPSQIFYYNGGARTTYPRPMYIGAVNDILIETACSQYSLSSVMNGFMARYLFNFPNSPDLTDEQRKAVEDGIRKKYTGAGLEFDFMMYWRDAGDEGLKIERIDSDDTVERYIEVKRSSRENIYTAFRATPNLFGLPTETTGFNAQEFAQAFKLFQKTTIAPMQKNIERVFAKIFGKDAIKIQPFIIDFNE